MRVSLTLATPTDAPAVAALRTATAEKLTREFGHGHWSSTVSEKGVLYALRNSRVFVTRDGAAVIGTLQLATKKPWAIDRSYFSDCRRSLYLTAMAVQPTLQRHGIGRAMLKEARRIVRAWPGDAIRLDAYDAEAGAGGFYARCDFREVGRATYRTVPLIYYELLL
jgi:ribosomal protein S18 acetylase RimI-like enzyme